MKLRERPQRLLGLAAICISITALLPFYFKTLFVAPTGNMSVISPWFACLLLLGFIYKKHWARRVALVICSLASFGLLVIILVEGLSYYKTIGLLFLLVLQVITILILRDRQVKNFLEVQV